MYKKRIAVAIVASVIVLTAIKGSIGMEASEGTDNTNVAAIAETAIEETYDMEQDDRLIIPSMEDVKKYGYPKNEAGETYGPEVYEPNQTVPSEYPDLSLAQNLEGVVGYIRESDLNPEISTIEEALKYNEISKAGFEVNMYLQDGKTCIGKFKIGGKQN